METIEYRRRLRWPFTVFSVKYVRINGLKQPQLMRSSFQKPSKPNPLEPRSFHQASVRGYSSCLSTIDK